jgi:hypothetical protein
VDVARFVSARTMNRILALLLILALSGCGCIYGRDFTIVGTNEHVCLDP